MNHQSASKLFYLNLLHTDKSPVEKANKNDGILPLRIYSTYMVRRSEEN